MAKGNDGIPTVIRRRTRLIKTALVLLTAYYGSGAVLSHFFENQSEKPRRPQRFQRQKQFISPLRRSDFFQKQRSIEDILNEHYTLINIRIIDVGNEIRKGSLPYNVVGTFCQIDWDLQRENPSTVPMFRDLQQQSTECVGTQINFDLFEVASKARSLDGENASSIGTPNGVVFHETRCGSTLSANLLASIPARVYSESPPPVAALRACRGTSQCSSPNQKQLVRDVFYLMGRVPPSDSTQRVFYKFQSITSQHIGAFTEVFPDVPWMFLYRDSVEVMMSHWKTDKVFGSRKPVCARAYGSQSSLQPAITKEVVKTQTPSKSLSQLSLHEYCAAHLAGLSLSTVKEHDRTGKGRFVNYNQLPDVMWEKVLPNDFGVVVTKEMRDNMKKVAGVYSKGRGVSANREWKEDSTNKKATASSKVNDAAQLYMSHVYNRMETLSNS